MLTETSCVVDTRLTFYIIVLAEELVIEGKNAIESPTSPQAIDLGPEFYLLGEKNFVL